ncbi:IMPACT family protein [Agarilytica rhodophyticola]|uniref:IMPACT family protein n=1 Tax=Agarilytica rhodophyticola TaxID=1737490 RepID=UPI000B344072|nr:YigZ family protein [Agarilytica rhodophyticola]
MSREYQVLSDVSESEYEIKKSRFIAIALPASSREQALLRLDETRSQYPDARHHCWAYLIGNPLSPALVAMSDDGEPSGTAGKPILNVLQHKCVGNIMLVVVRYFGGIKLGAGGLVRAYSSAAQQVMDKISTYTKFPLIDIVVEGGFALEQPLRHWLSLHSGEMVDVDYQQVVRFNLAIKPEELPTLTDFLSAQGGTLIAEQ